MLIIFIIVRDYFAGGLLGLIKEFAILFAELSIQNNFTPISL